MPVFRIRHRTAYRYRNPVALGEHRMRLRPRDGLGQRTIAFDLRIEPEPVSVAWTEDAGGDPVGSARFGRRAQDLVFLMTARVEVAGWVEPTLAPYARTAPFTYGADEAPDLAPFLENRRPDPDHAVDGWARDLLAADPARGTWAFLARLNAAIRGDFAYLRREEGGIQAPAFTLRTRSGACRDFAVLFVDAARALGIAARFASGYLHVPGPGDGGRADGAARDAGGATHAWAQAYLPGAGWVDFDPTSGSVGPAGLVRAAAVRDPAAAAPLVGSFMGFPSDALPMEVAVDVELEEPARAEARPRLYATER